MADVIWEASVRKNLDENIQNLPPDDRTQFKNWLRDAPEPPIDRWRRNGDAYCSSDITDILGRIEYCHDFVRDALRYYLHRIVYSEEHAKHYEENAIGLAQLINFVYYTERKSESGEDIINEVLDAVISTLSKYPRWLKVDVLAKVICIGSPIFIAVRLFNGFESISEPLPRSLLQSAAFSKDHFYLAPIQEGYSVATRIMGWGSNRLSNLGCHEGSSVDQKNMVTLSKFGGHRVTIFSVGVNHSLFFTENLQLYVTGRLKNWTGRSDDERIALTPIKVDLPTNAIPSGNLHCTRIYAGVNRSEIILSNYCSTKKKHTNIHIIAGTGLKGVSRELVAIRSSSANGSRETMRDERLTGGESLHMITNNFHDALMYDEVPSIHFTGSRKNKIDIEISADDNGFFFVSDSSKSLPRELRICVGNVMHRPHSIQQTAFCDNGDVFCLLQVDRMSRNFTLVKGEIRKLRVDQMEWTSKKSGKERKDEQYYLVAEQIAGAEHVVQFSVDRNGDNLLFETRDQPRTQCFLRRSSSNIKLNLNNDPEICYGGATRSLELLQRERDSGNVMVDDEELISLLPHSNLHCPRAFLNNEMIDDLKEESPISKRNNRSNSEEKEGYISEWRILSRNIRESIENAVRMDNRTKIEPLPDKYYGASYENGSLRLCVPRYSRINMSTKKYEDIRADSIMERIECFARDLFPFHYPNGLTACITGRSQTYAFVTIRPENSFGSLESEAKLRRLKMLRVRYNGQHEFDIAHNLWELHTPHFSRSVFHSSAITPVVECPFPESLMRMCERAFIDPSSTENYTTNQLLNMLDVADYLCANLLAEDIIYRLLRNATRSDINEVLGEILQTLNSRSSLVAVLSRFPHILLDWPIDIDLDILYETCERMQKIVGPVQRALGPIMLSLSPTPSYSNLSLYIMASQNCELAVGLNDLPLSNYNSSIEAITNIFMYCGSEDTILNLIDREDRISLLYDSFKGERGVMEKSKWIFFESNSRYEKGEGIMSRLDKRISIDLEKFLATVPPHDLASVVTPKEKKKQFAKRTRRHTDRKSEREEEIVIIDEKREEKKEDKEKKEEVEVEKGEEKKMEVESLLNNNTIVPVERRNEETEYRVTPPRSLAEIIREEEELEAAKKQNTPKRAEGRDGGRKSKFRPLSFSDSCPSATPSKNVDKMHDWTQSPCVATPNEKQNKSFTDIMQEQSERKSGVTRRRGPSVSGCQMEAAAIEALAQLYGEMIEDHHLVVVEVCRKVEDAPRWNADGDLYLE